MEKKRLRLEIYKPKRKIKVSKEETVPFLIRIGSMFIAMGGIISFVLSSIIFSIKSFFHVKQKIHANRIFNKKRYIELRIKKRQNSE